MRQTLIGHIGGAVIADYGPISLTAAVDLVSFYRLEACHQPPLAAAICRERAQALDCAVAAASRWRTAAGWLDPHAADIGRRRS